MYVSRSWAVAWLVAVSMTAVALTVWDKSRARQRAWRVPERTLWLVATLGGAAATYVTMLLIRHKTLHRRFMWGLPLLLLCQIAVVYLLWQEKCVFFT